MTTPEDLTLLVTSHLLEGMVAGARLDLPNKGDDPSHPLAAIWGALSHGERSILYTARDLARIRGRGGDVDAHLQSRIADAVRDLADQLEPF